MTALATIRVGSPYTGEVVGEAPVSDGERKRALLDAGRSYRDELSRHERARILLAVADAITARRGELAARRSR